MSWLFIAAGLIIFCFGFVIFFGAPYLPTLKPQQQAALDLLDLKPGDLLLEFGSGDGRMLAAAARRDIRCVGYELNPLLFLISWVRLWRWRRLARVKLASFWRADITQADAIFVFLLDKYMPKLDAMLDRQKHRPGLKLASYTFQITNRKVKKSRLGVFLYEYK